MATISIVLAFVFCVFAVEAFPNARRSRPGRAFVVYEMPPRCADAPKNDICDLGYKIHNVGVEKFEQIVSPFNETKVMVERFFPQQDAACPRLVMKALCRNVLPECLPNGRVDYGDRDDLFSQIEDECVYLNFPFGQTLVQQWSNFKTGIHEDPWARYYTLNCAHFPQDPGHKCPPPQYAMPVRGVDQYYERIRNLTRELAQEKELPKECYEKAFNVFGCTYAFCSADRKSILMTTSQADCEAIGECLRSHNAMDEEKQKILDKSCPKYPSPDKYPVVDLPLMG